MKRLGLPVSAMLYSGNKSVHAAVRVDAADEAALMESMLDGMADYYSRQLARNIRRGVAYNAKRCLSNGHKLRRSQSMPRGQKQR